MYHARPQLYLGTKLFSTVHGYLEVPTVLIFRGTYSTIYMYGTVPACTIRAATRYTPHNYGGLPTAVDLHCCSITVDLIGRKPEHSAHAARARVRFS